MKFPDATTSREDLIARLNHWNAAGLRFVIFRFVDENGEQLFDYAAIGSPLWKFVRGRGPGDRFSNHYRNIEDVQDHVIPEGRKADDLHRIAAADKVGRHNGPGRR